MRLLTITKVECTSVSANAGVSAGTDDVFIMHQSDGGMPLRYPSEGVLEMDNKTSKTLNPPLKIYFTYGAYVSLWDNDTMFGGDQNVVSLNDPDMLGNIGFLDNCVSTSFTLIENNGAKYKITASVTDA